MPRIYSSVSDPIDFCQNCFPDESEAYDEYGDLGDADDDRGNCFLHNAPHPLYENTDYTCDTCSKPLTKEDN